MEEEKLVPVEVTEVETKPDEESLKEETVVLKKDPEITDSGNEQEKVLILESLDDQVKKDENSTDVDILKIKTDEFEERAEQVLGEITNGVSHYFNGVGGKTEADLVNGDSAVESLDSGVLNSETVVKLLDAEVPVEEKTEEIESPIVEKVNETVQTEILIDEKTEEAEEIAEKIIQISEEKNGSVDESTLRELDAAESTEADIQANENVAEKPVADDAIIEGSSLTSPAVDLPLKEEIDESLKEKVEESTNIIERSTEVEISDSPIVLVATRTIQPTSWRNCCGLFEVLRRSDRR